MKTFPKTIAAAIVLSLVAAGSATASVEQDGTALSSKLDAALNKDVLNKDVLNRELTIISFGDEKEDEIDLVAEELKERLNLK